MVVTARLLWLRQQIAQGVPVHFSVGAAEQGRAKCKVIVEHASTATSDCARSLMLAALSALEHRAGLSTVVDRGHRHSDGNSQVTFWLSSISTPSAQHIGATTPAGGGGGADDAPRRPGFRRGRSPPGPADGSDPWHAPGGDPWGSIVPSDRKAPRQRNFGVSTASSSNSWQSYAPSSVTPDPPPLFRRHDRTVWRQKQRHTTASTSDSDDRFDPWHYLDGMAGCGAPVCGGIVLVPMCAADAPQGQSLLNVIHESQQAKRTAMSSLIARCIATSSCEDWKLKVNDYVYVGSESSPSIVMRIGYGAYEQKVRVAGIGDDRRSWATGRWVGTDLCHLLEVGDHLMATADIEDSSHERRIIPAGSVCSFIGQDEDGDLILKSGQQQFVIFAQDLDHLSMR